MAAGNQGKHPHEQVNIHINTSRKTSTQFSLLKITGILAAILMSCEVELQNSKFSIFKTVDAIELNTFNKIYINDV